MNSKRCYECKMGEHDNYDNNVHMVKIYDGTKYIGRKLMCEAHRNSFDDNGYTVKKA